MVTWQKWVVKCFPPPFKSCDQSSAIASCICIPQYWRFIWYWNFNYCTNLVYFIHSCYFVISSNSMSNTVDHFAVGALYCSFGISWNICLYTLHILSLEIILHTTVYVPQKNMFFFQWLSVSYLYCICWFDQSAVGLFYSQCLSMYITIKHVLSILKFVFFSIGIDVLASEDIMWHCFQAHFCRFEPEM